MRAINEAYEREGLLLMLKKQYYYFTLIANENSIKQPNRLFSWI